MNLMIRTDRAKLGLIGLGAALLIVVLGGAVPFGDPGEPLPGEIASRKAVTQPFDVYLTEQIEFEADSVAAIASSLPSNLARVVWLAPEGSLVAPGDALARFDPTPFEKDRDSALAELEDVKAQLEGARTESDIRRAELDAGLDAVRRQLAVALLDRRRLNEVDIPAERRAAGEELEAAALELARLADVRDMTVELFDRGFASREELDAAADELALARQAQESREAAAELMESVEFDALRQEADLEVERLQNELGRLTADRPRQLAVAEGAIRRYAARVRQLEALVQEAGEYIAASRIEAPVAGIVTYPKISFGDEQRKVQIGDTIWQRQAFLVLPDLASLVARARIREVDLGALQAGQPVTLTASAFPDLVLDGKVLSVGTVVDAEDPLGRRFEVRIATAATDERLRPGMTGRARIRTHSYEAAVVVPVDAVQYRDGEPLVWVTDDGEWVPRRVEAGGTDGVRIAIESGLAAGETVALVTPPDAAVE